MICKKNAAMNRKLANLLFCYQCHTRCRGVGWGGTRVRRSDAKSGTKKKKKGEKKGEKKGKKERAAAGGQEGA